MSIPEIEARQASESAVFAAAKEIRAILDRLASVELPDGRHAAEEGVGLATE